MSQETQSAADELIVRRERLEKIREMGIDPFGQGFEFTHRIEDCIREFEETPETEKTFKIAGRIMAKRGMGKASFCNLQDITGSIQFYVRKDAVSETDFEIFSMLYVGDIVGIEGTLFVTKKEELTLRVSALTLLSASIRPLPEKFHGLSDVETRYRKRYLDLIVNKKARDTFINRSRIITSFRTTLDKKNFIEVETPVLHTVAGGAAARPFVTYHNALKRDFYMRIATELHLKRLLVGGLERVYEIGRIFRNEGVSHKHNPEFTTIELYQAYSDYQGMMDITEELVEQAALACHGTTELEFNGQTINFQRPWKKVRFLEAICEYGNIPMERLQGVENLKALCKELKVDVDPKLPEGKLYDALFEHIVEPHLFQPTFVYDYPVDLSPLAKKITGQENMTYRFEAFAANMEIANAFSELNDPIDQKERFEKQLQNKEQGDDEAHDMDHDYVEALEYGMPPAGGLGIGIDRLAMLLSNQSSIREVILFPHMRNK
jgi:lysyl-tRNA synthetase class 2